MKTNTEKILSQAKKMKILRPSDLASTGVTRAAFTRLVKRGVLERVDRGLYVLAGATLSANISLAEACKRVPRGVICLLSALRFHGLTTQLPFEVWMAIDVAARKPKVKYPPLKIVRFSGAALNYGVEKHMADGIPIRVTSAPKTVADCFKYRNKIGLDVAIEALREFKRVKRGSADDLWKAAKVCRVAAVMRPYMEAIT